MKETVFLFALIASLLIIKSHFDWAHSKKKQSVVLLTIALGGILFFIRNGVLILDFVFISISYVLVDAVFVLSKVHINKYYLKMLPDNRRYKKRVQDYALWMPFLPTIILISSVVELVAMPFWVVLLILASFMLLAFSYAKANKP